MEIPSGWEIKEGKLVQEFIFENFTKAMQFINNVAVIAEERNHHPEIWNSYNIVRLTLSTHDAGNIVTEKDIQLANKISSIES